MKALLLIIGLLVATFGVIQLVAANEHQQRIAYYGREEAARRYGNIGSLLSEEDGWKCMGVGGLMALLGLMLPGAKRNSRPGPPTGGAQ